MMRHLLLQLPTYKCIEGSVWLLLRKRLKAPVFCTGVSTESLVNDLGGKTVGVYIASLEVMQIVIFNVET